MRKWTMKDTLKVKTRSVIILTIILTFVINKLINKILSHEVVHDNGIIYNYQFSLGIYGVVFAIPAGLISILIIKFFMNVTKRKSYSFANSFEKSMEFKWHSIYGNISGFILLYILFNLFSTRMSQTHVSHVWQGFIWWAVVLIVPVVIAVVAAKLMNKVMIRITNTNARLITEIETGKHNSKFPSNDYKFRVLTLLRKGDVSTIKGGLLHLKIRDSILIVAGGIGYGILSVLAIFMDSNASKGGGSNHTAGTSLNNSTSESYEDEKQSKSEANFKAEQKRKQADYSKKMFVKQANYNVKYAQSEWNRAVRDDKEYRKAKRDADSL